jgi:UDP-N-acetylmuramate dehydrogenase
MLKILTWLNMNISRDVPLLEKNTYRIGGKSLYYAEPCSSDELREARNFALEQQLPVFILGKGSNVLISDYGWPGLTINTSLNFSSIKWENEFAIADGGASLNTLINQSIAMGCSGMEQLSGIPGTVGGAVIMNAGAFDSCIADTFIRADVMLPTGEIRSFTSDEASLGYRTSRFKTDGGIVLRAAFKFKKSSRVDELKAVQKDILAHRKSKQPIEYPNCGSVFKRPEGNFAGTLIEKCGLKGLMSGDIQVSEKHANFIVNKGNGRAEDVRILIRTVQKRVYEQFGILLQPEVIFIGTFDEPLFEI